MPTKNAKDWSQPCPKCGQLVDWNEHVFFDSSPKMFSDCPNCKAEFIVDEINGSIVLSDSPESAT